MFGFGYRPFGTAARLMGQGMHGNPNAVEMGENIAGDYAREMNRERHEQSLQSSEQNRRHFDSQTARMKVGVLGGLLTGRHRLGKGY